MYEFFKEFQVFILLIVIIGLGFVLSMLSDEPLNFHVTWLITMLMIGIVLLGNKAIRGE